jgi:hypothetical protein
MRPETPADLYAGSGIVFRVASELDFLDKLKKKKRKLSIVRVHENLSNGSRVFTWRR